MRQRATNPCTIILLFVFTSACGAPTDPVDESSSKAAHRPPSQTGSPPPAMLPNSKTLISFDPRFETRAFPYILALGESESFLTFWLFITT